MSVKIRLRNKVHRSEVEMRKKGVVTNGKAPHCVLFIFNVFDF